MWIRKKLWTDYSQKHWAKYSGIESGEETKYFSAVESQKVKDVSECLYKRRNLLVHRERSDVRLEDELNALKSLCDDSISFFFANIDKLSYWKELDFYFKNISLK